MFSTGGEPIDVCEKNERRGESDKLPAGKERRVGGAEIEERVTDTRVPELDGLRGVAILFVIIYHYITNMPHGPSHAPLTMIGTALGLGASGVDLFFVLSGFLIGGILLDNRTAVNYYRTFYLRRMHRIFPIYYLWLLLFVVSGGYTRHGWVYPLFLQNYVPTRTAWEAFWLSALWTLGVEEQFYLLAPPLLRNARHLVKIILPPVIVFAFVFRLYLALRFGHAGAQDYWGLLAATRWLPARADELALGILCAVAWRSERVKPWIIKHVNYCKYAIAVSVVLLVTTLPLATRPNYWFTSTVGTQIFAVLYVSMLIVVLADKRSIIATASRWAVLREIGKVSYCIYIIHQLIDYLTHKLLRGDLPRFDSWPAIAVTMVACMATFLIAELSWVLIERPMIRRGHKYQYLATKT